MSTSRSLVQPLTCLAGVVSGIPVELIPRCPHGPRLPPAFLALFNGDRRAIWTRPAKGDFGRRGPFRVLLPVPVSSLQPSSVSGLVWLHLVLSTRTLLRSRIRTGSFEPLTFTPVTPRPV